MFVLPFFQWLIPREQSYDCCRQSEEEDEEDEEMSSTASWCNAKVSKGMRKGGVGSWIVSYDGDQNPYWTNDVTTESTYNLFVQTSCPGVPARHAASRGGGGGGGGGCGHQPPRKFPPSPSYRTKKYQNATWKEGGGGYWKEMYCEDGSKLWFHTGTRKKTYRDPFY